MKINLFGTIAAIAVTGTALFGSIASADSINQRLHDQQGRIHQGFSNDTLNRNEARNLRRRDANVLGQERRDRYMHHGHLTQNEREHLNARLNRDSSSIYNHKHDINSH